jgi:hypothetical protein
MFVFWKGKWHAVDLPACVDPSWGVWNRNRLALALLKGRVAGRSDISILEEIESVINRGETA